MITAVKSKPAAFNAAENWTPKCLFEFFGLSTDSKPTSYDGADVGNGSTLFEMDTSKRYVFNEDGSEWVEFTFCDCSGGGGGGSSTLSGLTDTTITSPSNGQVLTYNSSSSKWVNGDGCSCGLLVANDVRGTLDKTWQEIHDANIAFIKSGSNTVFITGISNDNNYIIDVFYYYSGQLYNISYYASSADEYPQRGPV